MTRRRGGGRGVDAVLTMGRLAGFWRLGAGAVSGVLLALTMPPWGVEWLVWVAFVPVLAALWAERGRDRSGSGEAGRSGPAGWRGKARRAVRRLRRCLPPAEGYVFGLVFFLTSLSWISLVSAPGWILVGAYLALYPWLWGWVARRLRPGRLSERPYLFSRHNLVAAGAAAAAWVAGEYLRSFVLSGFGWNNVSVALHNNLPMIQIAEVTGAMGPSFAAVFVNAVLLATARRFWEEALRARVRAHFDFTLTMAGVVGVFLFGAQRLQTAPGEEGWARVRVALIQTNIPLAQQRDPAFIPELLEIHRELTATAAAGGADLVVWPESSVPGGILLHHDTRAFVEGVMEGGGFALMHGTLDGDAEGDYNAVALRQAGGGEWQVHRKIHLVPFGEYFPFRRVMERVVPPLAAHIAELLPGDFTAGRSWTIFDPGVEGVRIGPLICFEDTLGGLTRRFVARGANLLVNVTNDAWFLESAASMQHFAAARFRAIENRRPLLRAANTGVTAIVDALGRARILESPEGSTFIRGYLSGEVAVPEADAPLTFYSRYGEIFPMICLVLTLLSGPGRSLFVAAARRRPAPTSR